MSESLLGFYMGYAYSLAVNLQHAIRPPELMVPYVVYWQGDQPTPVSYPAPTQEEAVARAHAAREEGSSQITGWASGREGLFPQGDGTKLDVLLIEGWVPGLMPPIRLLNYYRRDPFRLIHGFLWEGHTQVRRTDEDRREFMKEFRRGILSQQFGQQCLDYVARAEPVSYVRSGS